MQYRLLVATAAALLALTAGTAAASVGSASVMAGWPQNVGAGTLLPGPGGGVVVVSTGYVTPDYESLFVTTALRRDGRRLWVHRRDPACGNCDSGAQPSALQPDGTYGPIGYTGDDFWALDARGREMPGCSGAVTSDGTCYFVQATPWTIGSYPMPTAKAAAGDVWSVTDPGYLWGPEFDVPPVVVRDDSGLLYAGLGFGVEVPARVERRGRLIAVDPATRAIAWTRPDLPAVLTALGSGVLAARDGGVVSIGPDGTERWSRALSRKDAVSPATTVHDATRDRLYLGRTTGVTALVASTGVQVWRTRPSDRAELLSVGRSGRVYVSIGAAARRGVRALRLTDGSTAWQRRTRLPVRDALELADGSVVVSAGTSYPTTKVDRLTRLRPR